MFINSEVCEEISDSRCLKVQPAGLLQGVIMPEITIQHQLHPPELQILLSGKQMR